MPFLVFAFWLLLVAGAGWLFFPLAHRLCGHALPDGGLAVGRVLFLCAWSVLAFWLGHAGVSVALSAWLYPPLAALGLGFWWFERRTIRTTWKTRRRAVLSVEAAFLATFLVFWTLRGFWSDTSGTNGEKGMDSVLVAAISRATEMPPPNPYAAGAKLESYYILGHLQTALLTRATGTTMRWSYNLMCATLPALCVALLFSLGWGLTRRWGGGAFVAGTVLGLGTLQPIFQWLHQDQFSAGRLLRLDFFAVSRVQPFAINEFPWFTFNQADLHAHYFDFPIQLALMALAWALCRATSLRTRLPILGACSFLLGAQIMTNTWDFPAFAVLLTLAALLSPRTEAEPKGTTVFWTWRFGAVGATFVGALLLASMFVLGLNTAAHPPALLTQPTSPFREWLLMWAPLLFAWSAFGVAWFFRRRFRAWLVFVAAFLSLLLAAWLLQTDWGYPAGLDQLKPDAISVWLGMLNPARLVLPLLLGCAALALFLARNERSPLRFVGILALAGLFALGWSETVWAGFLGNADFPFATDWKRQDTIFKFGLQAWFLWGTAASAGAYLSLRRWPLALRFACVPFLLVMACSSLVDTYGRTHGFDPSQRQNWDGWAHLSRGEQDAARWLELNTPPNKNLLEAEDQKGGDFSPLTRFTHATGIPTIIGPQAHSFYWSPNPERLTRLPGESVDAYTARRSAEQSTEVAKRKADARLAFTTPSSDERLTILTRYGVRYVVWNQLEREQYGEAAHALLERDLKLVQKFGFDAGDDPTRRVEIFQVP